MSRPIKGTVVKIERSRNSPGVEFVTVEFWPRWFKKRSKRLRTRPDTHYMGQEVQLMHNHLNDEFKVVSP